VRLALQLNPIVDAAYALTAPGETDIVLAGASVAQSSREYWEVRLIPSNCNAEIQDGVAQNGACLGLYSDANTAVLQCLGLREPKAIIPTGFQQPGASRRSSTWLRVRPAGTRRRSAIRTSLAPSRGSGPPGPRSPRGRAAWRRLNVRCRSRMADRQDLLLQCQDRRLETASASTNLSPERVGVENEDLSHVA
jgi:hypothetical protein